jgi:hypothetical protein
VFPTRRRKAMLAGLVLALLGQLVFLLVSRTIAPAPLPAGCGFVPPALVGQLVPAGTARPAEGGAWSRVCEWSTAADHNSGPPHNRGAQLRILLFRCHEYTHPDAAEYCQQRAFTNGERLARIQHLGGFYTLNGVGRYAYGGFVSSPGVQDSSAVWFDLFAVRGPDRVLVEYNVRPSTHDEVIAGAASAARAILAGVR